MNQERIDKVAQKAWDLANEPDANLEACVLLKDCVFTIKELQSRIEALEKDCCQLIDERDERDEVIDALMSQVLGSDCKEWSSAYGFNDAVVDVECRMKELEKDAARYAFVKTMSKEMLLAWRGVYGFSDDAIDFVMQSEKGGV